MPREIGKVLPPTQYPIRELPIDHPIFKTMFTVTKIPQVPSWQYWSESGDDVRDGHVQRDAAHGGDHATRAAASWC